MPDTLVLLLEVELDICGRERSPWRFVYEFWALMAEGGGILESSTKLAESRVDDEWLVGTVILLTLLSVDLSVMKLALERLLRSFKNEGAIWGGWCSVKECVTTAVIRCVIQSDASECPKE